ncbi:Ragulator complex LAMTOR3, partial [Brachionus plicatilis]
NFGIDNIKNSHPIIIYKNFRYWWRTDNKDSSTRYVCSETNCFASIRIKQNKVVKQNGKHYHDSLTDSEIILLKSTQDLKKEVTADITKSIQKCYNNTQSQLVEQNVPKRMIAANLPQLKRIANTLHKKRGKKLPSIPNVFAELVIEGEYSLTTDKNQFLRYDNKSPDKRIIIFLDDQCLKIMSDSEEWFIDGTFKASPIQLTQLFTIHVAIKGSFEYTTIPCAYILASLKDEKTYREAFGFIKDLAIEKNFTLNPVTVMTDFEIASINAIKFHFPNVILKGCWFHFRQAVFRNSVKFGLKQHYHKDEYREFINLLGALSLLPLDKVEEGFQKIKSYMPNDPKCDNLYKYFERQWIKNTKISEWNHHNSNVRTNYRIEGFHSGLNKMITSYHPNIFVLIKHLKVQQDCSLYPYEYWFDSEGAINNDEDTTIEQSSKEQECGNHDQEIAYAQL